MRYFLLLLLLFASACGGIEYRETGHTYATNRDIPGAIGFERLAGNLGNITRSATEAVFGPAHCGDHYADATATYHRGPWQRKLRVTYDSYRETRLGWGEECNR